MGEAGKRRMGMWMYLGIPGDLLHFHVVFEHHQEEGQQGVHAGRAFDVAHREAVEVVALGVLEASWEQHHWGRRHSHLERLRCRAEAVTEDLLADLCAHEALRVVLMVFS